MSYERKPTIESLKSVAKSCRSWTAFRDAVREFIESQK